MPFVDLKTNTRDIVQMVTHAMGHPVYFKTKFTMTFSAKLTLESQLLQNVIHKHRFANQMYCVMGLLQNKFHTFMAKMQMQLLQVNIYSHRYATLNYTQKTRNYETEFTI